MWDEIVKSLVHCDRCARLRTANPCPGCQRDVALEAEWGVAIPMDQWPIENLADFERAVEHAAVEAGLPDGDGEDEQ